MGPSDGCGAEILLGSVADLPTRRDAQVRLDERLRPVNQGAGRPESIIGFGAFVEQQWKVLALPNFKRSTQHGYQAVLRVHVLPAWRTIPLRDIDRLAIQQWVADGFVTGRLAIGPECVGAALQHPRVGGRIRVSAGEPGAGSEVPAKGAEEEARDDRRGRLREAARAAE